MARGYFYLISALPELSLNDKDLEYDMVSYRDFVKDHLNGSDLKFLKILYYRYDILNLVNLIKENKSEWIAAGNYSREELTEMIGLPDSLPTFMRLFYEDTRKKWSTLSEKELINRATTYFMDWSERIDNRFLRRWLRFDHNLKNLLIWLNSHKFGLDPTHEVLGNQYEADYLRETRFDEIDLKAWDFRYREVMTQFDNPNIAIREFVIDEMRWHFLDELEQAYDFGIEKLLGFAIKLQIIHRNIQASEVEGKKNLMSLLDNIREGYDVPQGPGQSATSPREPVPGLVEMIDEETKEIST
jgi:hypothetical protein